MPDLLDDRSRFRDAVRALVPRGIEVACRIGCSDELAFDAERELARTWVQSRRDEFLTGRTCAREALRRLGVVDAPILPAESRAPLWPDGVVGSISHSSSICLAAVGHSADFFGIGVDVEGAERVEAKLEKFVASPEEAARFAGLHDWRTLLFSAKESVFKSLNPATGIWLEFHDVELLTFDAPTFEALVTPRDDEAFRVSGTYVADATAVVTAVVFDRQSDVAQRFRHRTG